MEKLVIFYQLYSFNSILYYVHKIFNALSTVDRTCHIINNRLFNMSSIINGLYYTGSTVDRVCHTLLR